MREAIRAALLAAIFSAVAVIIHSWQRPFGLFLALLVLVAMMRFVASFSSNRFPTLIATGVWFFILWIASTERNGDELLVQGDTLGSSFLVGGSALMVLLSLTAKAR